MEYDLNCINLLAIKELLFEYAIPGKSAQSAECERGSF